MSNKMTYEELSHANDCLYEFIIEVRHSLYRLCKALNHEEALKEYETLVNYLIEADERSDGDKVGCIHDFVQFSIIATNILNFRKDK
ncbi:MAG: hypothetical protein V4501_11365 [Pseudomonadota bacterium]